MYLNERDYLIMNGIDGDKYEQISTSKASKKLLNPLVTRMHENSGMILRSYRYFLHMIFVGVKNYNYSKISISKCKLSGNVSIISLLFNGTYISDILV